jgi:hypothetical protein
MGREIFSEKVDGDTVYTYRSDQDSELLRIADEFGIGEKDVIVYPYGVQINDMHVLTLSSKDIKRLEMEVKKHGYFERLSEEERRYEGLGGKCKLSFWDEETQEFVEFDEVVEVEKGFLLSPNVRKQKIDEPDGRFWWMCDAIIEYARDEKKNTYTFISET